MATSIVEARPDHAAFIAWAILTAFRSHRPLGLWDFMLDAEESEVLRYLECLASTQEPHWAHYSVFLVAEVDGTPAAALSGYFDEELGIPALQKGTAEADPRYGRTAADAAAGVQRIAPIFRVMPRHEPGTWLVESVATRPDYRRRGLVDALLAEILERGRERRASQAGIGVMIGNDRAQRAYEKAGFRVFSERRDPDFERIWGCPGLRALSRTL